MTFHLHHLVDELQQVIFTPEKNVTLFQEFDIWKRVDIKTRMVDALDYEIIDMSVCLELVFLLPLINHQILLSSIQFLLFEGNPTAICGGVKVSGNSFVIYAFIFRDFGCTDYC